jgi:flagellar basal-body rod protein FlgG
LSSSLFHILNISRQDMLGSLNDLDVTSNNLANVNTAGFKSSRANFQELLDKASQNGSHLSATQVLTSEGSIRETDRTLDWAVQGEGYFAMKLPGGETGYTRDGQFDLDSQRQLVNSSGLLLNWEGQVPEGTEDVSVQPDGTVLGLQGGNWDKIGTVQLTRFPNPSGLHENGQNIWMETEASGKAETKAPGTAGFGWIQAQSVEQSNVDLSNEMTHMMTLQRAFQMSVRTFQQTDQMITQAIHMRKV